MTFASVLLFCCGGIAICAFLVFLVETVVAFCSNERERFVQPGAGFGSATSEEEEFIQDLAA